MSVHELSMHTRFNDAVERVGNAHRDTLLVWYALMRELAGERGEFSTSVEHWARRYGADVPSKGGDYYASWRSIQEQFWQAFVDAGVIEADGSVLGGERFRVRVVDTASVPRKVLVRPYIDSAYGLDPKELARARSARHRHNRALREHMVTVCSNPAACSLCEAPSPPDSVTLSVVGAGISTERDERDGHVAQRHGDAGDALVTPPVIHASAPPHTHAPDYSEQSSSSPEGVPNNNPKSGARSATPTKSVVDELPPSLRTAAGQIRRARFELGAVQTAIDNMIARRNGARDSMLPLEAELREYWKPACDLLVEFGAQRLRDAIATAGDKPVRIGYLRSILQANEQATATAQADDPDLGGSQWAGHSFRKVQAPTPEPPSGDTAA